MKKLTPGAHRKIPDNNSKKVDSILEKQNQNELHRTSLEEQHYKTILILDDEPDIAFTLKLALENSNERYRIHTYNNPITVTI